ncbi:MAG: ATP-dependent metallopeptidase FtsH/Yme1/Tma family protein [Chromatiaceae bacterium]|nr:ATP-dependent metallopeptidase FtsH/Yme1/Tma family protein [Chromatiaceae bacterium]MCP5314490.1 ATP-dependent metallopeptidase FtsH/Yme1/Tma family protein [Chromatiaceae bacterium]
MDIDAFRNPSLAWLTWLPLVVVAAMMLISRLRLSTDKGPRGAESPATDRRSSPGGNPPPAPQSVAVWWALLIALVGWNLAGMFMNQQTPTVAKVPYSSFVAEVKAGNVERVGIQGSEIIGKLRRARDWDRHTGQLSTVTPAKASPGTANPATKADKSGAVQTKKASPAVTSTPAKEKDAVPKAQVVDFTTVFPSSVGDPRLLPLLETNAVEIVAVPKPPHWFAGLLGTLLPTALLVGFFWWMGRRAMKQQQSIFGTGQSQARRFNREQAPAVTFADVAGADAAKGQLQEIVSILKFPDRYRSLGARIPRGVLLAGPPGTGKTLLARAVAGEAQVPFFSISGSEFVEMFVGVGASRVRNLFKEVKEAAPAILFVDELDAVGRRRGAGLGQVNDEREQTLNQLLVEMDGFDDRINVIVLAATNRPDVLDPALRRPGRFDREVVVGLPDLAGRRGILGIHSQPLALADNVDLDVLAAITMGMSGAQLANLCNEAALVAAREGHDEIARKDFEIALDRIVLGDIRPLALDPAARRVIAYHESGHALVAWLTPGADPVHKVTIVPHGMALGVTEQRPSEDLYNLSREYLGARLRVMLGGRTAEETAIGEITTGAENDLIQATRLARRMVTAWGMSELGLAAYESSGEDRFLGYELGQGRPYSEDTARRVDAEIERLLSESHDAVRRLLEAARERLDRLASALLEKETVEYDDLLRLLGPRPETPDEPRQRYESATAPF